ncbi:MAG: thioredoxin domain-containing protein [Chloroflexi bacterium]|nr:thioredoxin domain-containing protein [Chloroflexota bacterium]
MTTQPNSPPTRQSPIPWRKRAGFQIGKTRRQRQEQYKQQVNTLLIVVLAAVVLGGLWIYTNWAQAGEVKLVSCAEYPEYCVPLAGGGEGAMAALEVPESRSLDQPSEAAVSVIRGVTPDGMPVIGNPDAPVHFAVVSDYACPHCQNYHSEDWQQFLDDYVLTGQASFRHVMVTGTGREYSRNASLAALCAGEQGATWEYSAELYRLAESQDIRSAFSIGELIDTAGQMGLDEDALEQCLVTERYSDVLNTMLTFSQDNGVTGTPTVLMTKGNGSWSQVGRDYSTLAGLTDSANAQ